MRVPRHFTSQESGPYWGTEFSCEGVRRSIEALAAAWTGYGELYQVFDTPSDALAFYDEARFLLNARIICPRGGAWKLTASTLEFGLGDLAKEDCHAASRLFSLAQFLTCLALRLAPQTSPQVLAQAS